MMLSRFFRRESVEVPCTIQIEHTFNSLHAHVELDGGVTIEPGDEVRVHGEPIVVPYGETRTIRRTATVTKAGLIERAWTRATGDLEFMELCEFSFSSGRKL
jgi:uncharacterized Zn finger protein